MKIALGLVLTLLGLGIVLYGMGSALRGLSAIYSNALESPLDEPSVGNENSRGGATGEKAISQKMLESVLVGSIGLPPLLIGSVLLKWGIFSRWRRRSREAQERRQAAMLEEMRARAAARPTQPAPKTPTGPPS